MPDVRRHRKAGRSGVSRDRVLFLHGGFNPIEMLGQNLPTLAERHRVYLPERQGQGRTPDRDGPITHETMARDTPDLVNRLILDFLELS